ncbi:Uncharacterized protein LOCC1_G006141 [Lachnellula occidentalis]|uniref:DUF4419 domain-containing protein n=1 Tax=Lachnellula occidentalis TaxID=215460 RepID=A0A8H8RWL2_9HELO|nr:Uncharacterized protein LOCC1_G006141 [Lachnellula occidentalis]
MPAGPVTIYPASHGANEFKGWGLATNTSDLMAKSCPKEFKKIKDNHILQSSFDNITAKTNIFPSSNSFVNGAVTAYSDHQHLEIRPEDVWLSILSQLNIYINAHAEELRDMFVAHQGQKNLDIDEAELDIRGEGGGRTKFRVDWGKFSYKMTQLIAENVKDPSLREWIIPSFTTTGELDRAVAAIMMMATMQQYFSYSCSIMCGLPSVTLLGEKSDWEELAKKAERLVTFGEEPKQWYALLKPVLARFVTSFDAPEAEETKDFWQKIAHYSGGGSGPTYLSGWITAFCFWDGKGKSFYNLQDYPPDITELRTRGRSTPILQLDAARYHRIERGNVPPGWASVPVLLVDEKGDQTRCVLVAGHVALKATSSGKALHASAYGETGLDTIRPVSGWWMYKTKSEGEFKAAREVRAKELVAVYGHPYMDDDPDDDPDDEKEWMYM